MSERIKSPLDKIIKTPNILLEHYILENPIFWPAIEKTVSYLMSVGWNPTPQEIGRLQLVVRKFLKGEPTPAKYIGRCFESLRSQVTVIGVENIPKSGSTIFIGNHPPGGPLHGMWSYFMTADIAYDARDEEVDRNIREPYVIVQEGLTKDLMLPFFEEKRIIVPGSAWFYGRLAKSTRWGLVAVPEFDKNGQIINDQKGSPDILRRLFRNGAMIIYPQGTYRKDDIFPERAGKMLTILKEKNIQLVPVMAIVKSYAEQYLIFGKSVHIKDLGTCGDGSIDINENFVIPHLKPLGGNLPLAA